MFLYLLITGLSSIPFHVTCKRQGTVTLQPLFKLIKIMNISLVLDRLEIGILFIYLFLQGLKKF